MFILRIIKPFFYAPFKHVSRLLCDADYRRYWQLQIRYGGVPRYRERTIRVGGMLYHVPDVASFLAAYREIFVEKIYAFECDAESPQILDCGANIGLSVMYFKSRFPGSHITAYEADPDIFAVLRKNLAANGINGVDLVQRAVWSGAGSVDFRAEGADGGRITSQSARGTVQVEAEPLASILAERDFDFVKVDIEGAEIEVFLSGEVSLDGLERIFVEYHSFIDKPQRLGQLLDLFEKSGFRVHVHPPFISPTPFLGIRSQHGMDMQLNLFFWRG